MMEVVGASGEVLLPTTESPKDSVKDVCRKSSNASKTSTKSSTAAVAATNNVVKKKPKLSKDISLMMKALNTLESPEEKIAALCKKYSDLLQDFQVAQKQLDASHKREHQLQKEVARGQNDKRKMTLANSRLENLARELQKRNLSEETKVREMADRLKSSLSDAESQMRKAMESNDRLSNDYLKIKREFEDLAGKNKIRDKKIENVIEQYKLELKLMTVEHKKYVLELERDLEAEKLQRKTVTDKLKEQREAFELQQKLVASLQEQIKFYDKKFREFQGMLQKSNDTCDSLATQHDKMKKRLNSMESERQTLRHKLEQKAKQATEAIKQNERNASKQTRLEKLCRALQNERNDLVQQLRDLELQLSSPSSSSNTSTAASSVNRGRIATPQQEKEQLEEEVVTNTTSQDDIVVEAEKDESLNVEPSSNPCENNTDDDASSHQIFVTEVPPDDANITTTPEEPHNPAVVSSTGEEIVGDEVKNHNPDLQEIPQSEPKTIKIDEVNGEDHPAEEDSAESGAEIQKVEDSVETPQAETVEPNSPPTENSPDNVETDKDDVCLPVNTDEDGNNPVVAVDNLAEENNSNEEVINI